MRKNKINKFSNGELKGIVGFFLFIGLSHYAFSIAPYNECVKANDYQYCEQIYKSK